MDINIVRHSDDKTHWNNIENVDIEQMFEDFSTHISGKHDVSEKSLSVVLSNDVHIQNLNATFRQQDKPTNILSFPFENDEENIVGFDTHNELGDLILAYETLERETKQQNKSFNNHFTHLCLHGLLHLLEYDHIEDDEAEIMESLEIEILSKMDINNPYQDNV